MNNIYTTDGLPPDASSLLPPTCALVLHFRAAPSTAACIASLQAEGIGHLVLVDNSEDQGRSLLELSPALDAARAQGMIIAIVEPGTNLGFSVGVNRGLAAVREHWGAARVLLINSDATLLPGALAALHGSLDQGAYLAAPLLVSPDGHVKRLMYYQRLTGLLFPHDLPGAFPHLSGCCLLLSESAARQDLLDERFFFYGEDAFLGWTLVGSGNAAVVVESARVVHLGSGSSRRGSLFYEYHMARAHMELATAMSRNRFEAVWLLLGRCLSLPARALWRAFRQRSMAPIRGLSMAVHDFRRGQISKLTPKAG